MSARSLFNSFYPEALARLAILTATTGDSVQTRVHAGRALQQNPLETAAALALAMADLEDREFDVARIRATQIILDAGTAPINRSIAEHLLGDAEDGLGLRAEAFAAYTAANATAQAWYRPTFEAEGMETAITRIARLTAYFQTAEPGAWAAHRDEAPSKSPVKAHIFLVGFPRSGTTLLEQVLIGHRDVV